MSGLLSRRRLLIGAGGIATGIATLSAGRIVAGADFQPLLDFGDAFNRDAQRLALWDRPVAREYRVDQLSINHPSVGGFGASYIDHDPAYDRMVLEKFANWRLKIGGQARRPSAFTLSNLRSMPRRTQITMHCCDAGWSAIGQWSGVPLGWLLRFVDILPSARHVVFYAMDKMAGRQIFDSIDLIDAIHPQTILAYDFNGEPLPVAHGAPLRLRMELQVGYKQLKHIDRIVVVDSLDGIAGGRGGFYELGGLQSYGGL